MEIRKTKSNDHAILSLGGRFDFNAHREFKEAYSSLLADATIRSIEVNLSGVDYLDSSALGMLLMMRERVESAGKQISLSNANETVVKILEIANFKKLFKIT
jgi:anti-anti-sigma factor